MQITAVWPSSGGWPTADKVTWALRQKKWQSIRTHPLCWLQRKHEATNRARATAEWSSHQKDINNELNALCFRVLTRRSESNTSIRNSSEHVAAFVPRRRWAAEHRHRCPQGHRHLPALAVDHYNRHQRMKMMKRIPPSREKRTCAVHAVPLWQKQRINVAKHTRRETTVLRENQTVTCYGVNPVRRVGLKRKEKTDADFTPLLHRARYCLKVQDNDHVTNRWLTVKADWMCTQKQWSLF